MPATMLPLIDNAKPSEESSANRTPECLSPSAPNVTAHEEDCSSGDDDHDSNMEGINFSPEGTPFLMHDLYDSAPRDELTADIITTSKLRTGVVYDPRMRFHMDISTFFADESDTHPEDSRRIFEIYRELVANGLINEAACDDGLLRLEADYASKEDICLIHSSQHYDNIKALQSKSDIELYKMGLTLDSVYLHQETFSCAQLSAGGAIEACRAVVCGKVKNSIAIIRPPGHHAEQNSPGGFCFFNNVCIAAKVCQRDFPDKCRKILIVDWDVHHGNGVQQAFYNDSSVLYISIHVYKNGTFYPPGPYGNHLHCGQGDGLGYNVNIPWSNYGMDDADYMLAFQSIVMPIAQSFNPDLAIVSAGFDAAEGDKLGGCFVTPAGYSNMTHMLKSLANGKLVLCLEGGYNLDSISKCALSVTRTLMGGAPERLNVDKPSISAVSTVNLVLKTQSKYWKCLYPKDLSFEPEGKPGSTKLSDVIRSWQAKTLWDEFNMSPLLLPTSTRWECFKSWKNNILTTWNFVQSKPLLIVFHDPPQVFGHNNAETNGLVLHNTWLTDPIKSYIEWAVNNDFTIIDFNLPNYIKEVYMNRDVCDPEDLERARRRATLDAVSGLWNNYIEIYHPSKIILITVGSTYSGVLDFLSCPEFIVNRSITALVSFITQVQPLQAVRKSSHDPTASWFYTHSRIYLSSSHPVWLTSSLKPPDPLPSSVSLYSPDLPRRLRKYGHLVLCQSTCADAMLSEAFDHSTHFIKSLTNIDQYEDPSPAPTCEPVDSKFPCIASSNSKPIVSSPPKSGSNLFPNRTVISLSVSTSASPLKQLDDPHLNPYSDATGVPPHQPDFVPSSTISPN